MLRLFRKIRQNLFETGQTKKYILYAFGEILLVVIGILIAIGLNNWWQERQNHQEAALILQNLKAEFLYNQQDLEEKLQITNNAVAGSKQLLAWMNKDINSVDVSKMDSMLTKSFIHGFYHPQNGVTEILLNSGKLNLIKNDQLRTLIASWSGMVEDIGGMEESLKTI